MLVPRVKNHEALVVNFEAKLDDARVGCSGRNCPESTFARLSAGRKNTIGLSECWGVCEVEDLGTKLEVQLFSETRVFDKRDIRVPVIGAAHWISRGIAQGELWRFLKGGGVEPFVRAALIGR